MRLVKALLAAGVLAGLLAIGSHRRPVLAAYRPSEEPPAAIAFAGLDLDIGLTPLGPSPYVLATASDHRERSTGATVHPLRAVAEPITTAGGRASLSGTVVGPEGPVPGATVRIERAARRGLATIDLVTDEAGRYELPSILGGRYRIRAWVGGSFTMTTSSTLFLTVDEQRIVELVIGPVDVGPDLGFTHRGDIEVGATGTVAVSITTRLVGDDGIVNIGGIAGATVDLAPSPGVAVTAAHAITDAAGVARFALSCHQPGPATATVTYGNLRATAVLPTCVHPLPAPTETSAAAAPAETPDHVHQRLVTEIVTPTAPVPAAPPGDSEARSG